MDDTELAHHLARDLDGSFEHVVRAHVDRCHSIALRMTGNPHDAEEITQDAFIRAYKALGGYPPERIKELRVRPWLATIVLNLCRSRARSRPRIAHASLTTLAETGLEPAAGADSDPAGLALAGSARDRLASHLAALPDRYRVPIVLRHVDDLSYADLAAILGRPEGTLKSQVHRGLVLLREAMAGADLEELTA